MTLSVNSLFNLSLFSNNCRKTIHQNISDKKGCYYIHDHRYTENDHICCAALVLFHRDIWVLQGLVLCWFVWLLLCNKPVFLPLCLQVKLRSPRVPWQIRTWSFWSGWRHRGNGRCPPSCKNNRTMRIGSRLQATTPEDWRHVCQG
jgi:hypothetical protein